MSQCMEFVDWLETCLTGLQALIALIGARRSIKVERHFVAEVGYNGLQLFERHIETHVTQVINTTT